MLPAVTFQSNKIKNLISLTLQESIGNDLVSIKSSIEELTNMDESIDQLCDVTIQQRAIQEQQSFIEYLAIKDRQNNLIITGLPESDNNEVDIEDVFRSVGPDLDLDTSID